MRGCCACIEFDYDEVDLVLEGPAGDVFYIPKGSKILFGTPWRTKAFYVKYPADWASTALVRPLK